MPFKIQPDKIRAFIFDLDGVVTDTASLHFEAWKKMFDEFLNERSNKENVPFKPFQESDYLDYVDGKPRYDGVKDFLASRIISIPYGAKEDQAERETACGLGNRKNAYFLQILDKRGAKVYESTIDLIHALKSIGMKVAVISSSRNCAQILSSAGIQDLFDVKVDGVDLETQNIAGKPDPAMLLEAAKRLSVRPEFVAIVEDSLSGVEAGSRGRFGLVIGVARKGNADKLTQRGADVVVRDLAELQLENGVKEIQNLRRIIPSALESEELDRLLASRKLSVFLDYDGTLTEIVQEPSMALLSEETRNVLRKLSSLCPVAVISGRDVEDVKRLVEIERIVYSGSHGFDIITTDGTRKENSEWLQFLPYIDQAEKELRAATEEIPGVIIERKRFAISVHYRKVDPENVPLVEKRFNKIASDIPMLRTAGGKKIFELLPNVEWNKGRALLLLLKTLRLEESDSLPIFIGDDITDEDAFKVIGRIGLGIFVGQLDRSTFAQYSLRNPKEVRGFLQRLIEILKLREK